MSVFADILRAEIAPIEGATGAVFADGDGESIGEWEPASDADRARLMGAHWGVIFVQALEAAGQANLGALEEISITCAAGKVVLRCVRERYYLA